LSPEIINLICEAEMNAAEAKRHAEEQAADMIGQAHRIGRSGVEATLTRAESEITHLIRASDQKSTEDAAGLASSTANRLATLRARAERRLGDAAAIIFENLTAT